MKGLAFGFCQGLSATAVLCIAWTAPVNAPTQVDSKPGPAPDTLRTVPFESPETTQPLPVGARVPDLPVYNLKGEAVPLPEVVGDGATLIFYRGGW